MARCTKCGMERHDWLRSGSRGGSRFPSSNHDMRRKLFWPAVAFFAAIVNLAFFTTIFAQSVWLDRRHDKTLMLEIFKPVYNNLNWKHDNEFIYSYFRHYAANTSALFLSLRWPVRVGVKTFLVAELPFAHAEVDTRTDTEMGIFRGGAIENTIGNPYLGLEMGEKISPVFTEIGIRLPFTPDDDTYAAAAGSISDLDRSESFGEFAALRVIINSRYQLASGLVLGLRGGPVLLFQRWDADFQYMSVIYSAGLGYEAGGFSIGSSFTGRSGSDIYEENMHQLGFAAHFALGNLRPGAYFSLPLDYPLIDSVVGLNLGLRIK